MGECISKKKLNKVFTGGNNPSSQLFHALVEAIEVADNVDIIASFVMESGVRMLLPPLKKAVEHGAKVRIITGRYLGITQPQALYLIRSTFGDEVDLHFYDVANISFHPKCYFVSKNNRMEAFLGSSNVSHSALAGGIEWNYRITPEDDLESLQSFHNEFERIFNYESVYVTEAVLKEYSESWVKPVILKDIEKATSSITKTNTIEDFKPRGAQIEALYALDKTRKDGFDKALICAATGIGKTYLAAFDSRDYKRVLFVAHRKEILVQAERSFKNVRKASSFGFFDADEKNNKADIVFASVMTLGNSKYLNPNTFTPDYFDYIVIDEFHHAVNDAYLNVIKYFKPKFLLGLTATPDRYDRRDIYILCNYNVPYQITLKQGIERGMLVPFRYYGIYDSFDYSSVRRVNGRYSESELTQMFKDAKNRKELIFKHYRKHSATRTLGFCCTRQHAIDMAAYFVSNGVRAVAVCSNTDSEFSLEREIALDKLEKREIDVIFSVDMFNEGLDISNLDMVMFLRPTESPVVFLQQLGRGLRIAEGKEYLTVLDFIGNYVNAGRLPRLLLGNSENSGNSGHEVALTEAIYPKGCFVDFDLDLIDLFERMARNSMHRNERAIENLRDEYRRIRACADHSLNALDFYSEVDMEVFFESYQTNRGQIKRKALPPCIQNFLVFKKSCDDMTDEENDLLGTIAEEFLNRIGSLNMDKSYKMPILLAFLNGGDVRMHINEDDVYQSYYDYYHRDGNWRDLEAGKTTSNFREWKRGRYISEAKKNPITMMAKSDKFFFRPENGESWLLSLDKRLEPYINNKSFIRQFEGMIGIRSAIYYRTNYD